MGTAHTASVPLLMPREAGLETGSMRISRLGLLIPLRLPSCPEVISAVSRRAVSSPSAIFPEGNPDMVADPTSTDQQYHREGILTYHSRDIPNILSLEIPDPTEFVAAGIVVHVNWSIADAVGQIVLCCKGADLRDPLNAPFWVLGWKCALHRQLLFTAEKHRPWKPQLLGLEIYLNSMESVKEGTPTSKSFALLITRLNSDFDSGECATTLACIQKFVVPVGTLLKTYLTKYQHLVTGTMQGDNRFPPKQDTLVPAFINNIWA